MSKDRKILLSGIQPSGRPHIGNYFGAMKQFVELQKEHETFIFIADYHALTTLQNPKELKQNILNVAIDYLAIGLDPKNVTLYKQSDIPEHMELAWIFECLTTVPYLERAHAFKDAQAKRSEVNVGTFNYPLLMAADILLYDADVVPVGQDQKQHVEIARDTAEKFNRVYGETFKLPQPMILSDVSVVPGIDGEKMSKSKGNTIPLFAEDAEIEKCVMSIVTDSSGGIPKNVHEIHTLFALDGHRPTSLSDGARLDDFYAQNEGKYKILKEALIEDIKTFIRPLREKRKSIAEDKEAVLKMLKEGGLRARAKASAKMEEVREKVGVKLY
ncbi:MAG: Tryptophan-tRNA ligase [Parcubacteria group bacterium GW2011_GWA2_49_9]|nr:MAG: Tryptophan-tRNA ligase [Parcubacteria group bacterium GW2011_GWA2_49_9]